MGERHIPEDEVSKSEQRMREGYDKKYSGDYHGDWRETSSTVIDFFNHYKDDLTEGAAVLEIGAGQGRNLIEPAKMGFECHGLEISAEGVKEGQKVLAEEGVDADLLQGSFYELPYSDESFEAVFSNASLHGIPPEGANKAFQETSRVLKEQGLFMVYVSSTAKKDRLERGDDRMHRYTREQLETLAQENGFDIEEMQEREREDEEYEEGRKAFWIAVFRKN